jgi:hypothetical protein
VEFMVNGYVGLTMMAPCQKIKITSRGADLTIGVGGLAENISAGNPAAVGFIA